MSNYSLSQALTFWRKSPSSQNIDQNFEKYLNIALRLYVIPEFDYQALNLKPKQFNEYYKKFSVDQLKNALIIFEKRTQLAIRQGKLSENTKNNYRSALKRFLEWMQAQIWWSELFYSPVDDTDVAPFREQVTPKKTRRRQAPYGLKITNLPEYLLKEIEVLKEFRISGGKNLRLSIRERRSRGEGRLYQPKIDPIQPSTFTHDEQAILRFLGWYAKHYPDLKWHLNLLTDVELLDEYTYWAVTEREVSYSTGVNMVGTGVAIAKWLNYDKSKRRDWSDIPLVLELQDLQSEYGEIYKEEKKQRMVEKWADKKLTHQQARQVVQYLQKLCAPNYGRNDKETGEFLSHGRRCISAVVRAWQVYLLVKILVYCPVRQEEIRNLKLGETLLRKLDEQGNPYYIVKLKEHKRSSLTGQPRHYRFPAILTNDLDMWVYKWRPLIEESTKTLEGWMKFSGYEGDKIEQIESRLEAAKQGILGDKVSNSLEQYIEQEEQALKRAKNRIAAWEVAKKNLASHNYLFFILTRGKEESFGTPHYVASVWRLVNRAIARGTKTLFGEARWTNPHALRHIAEAHIRQIGKSHIAGAFGTLIGHSKEMGDEYASQVLTEYDLTGDIVDNWWE